MRRFRFSLKTWLLVFLCLTIALGYIASEQRVISRQEAALLQLGMDSCGYQGMTSYIYNCRWSDEPRNPTNDALEDFFPWCDVRYPPEKLAIPILGRHFGHRVVELNLASSELPPDQATEIVYKKLPNVEIISLPPIVTEDSDLLPIGSLAGIRIISLNGCIKIDGSCFRHFEGSHSLQALDLRGTSVQSKSMINLSKFRGLRVLLLPNSGILPTDLHSLAPLHEMQWLELPGSMLINSPDEMPLFPKLRRLHARGSNSFVQSLPRYKYLAHLDLAGSTLLDDRGATALAECTNLEILDLSRSNISDTTLRAISSLGKLRILRVSSTKVTRDGVKWIQNALPGITIELE